MPDADFVQAQFFLNPGDVSDETLEDGTVVSDFTSLPKGLALDTMEDAAYKATDTAEFIEKMEAQNMVKKLYAAECAGMKPGDSKLIWIPAMLTCRKGPTVPVPAAQSKKLSALDAKLAAIKERNAEIAALAAAPKPAAE